MMVFARVQVQDGSGKAETSGLTRWPHSLLLCGDVSGKVLNRPGPFSPLHQTSLCAQRPSFIFVELHTVSPFTPSH